MKMIIFFLVFCFSTQAQVLLNKHWLYFNKNNSQLKTDIITSIAADSEGNYWITTWPEIDTSGQIIVEGNLYKLSNNNLFRFDSSNSPLNKNILLYDVAVTQDRKVLIGTNRGLYILSLTSNTWDSLNMRNSPLPVDMVDYITVDKFNRYWLGLIYYGIALYNNGQWTFYNNDNSFPYISDYNFVEIDSNNVVWVGTDLFGLYSFDGVNWERRINGPWGLPPNENNVITSLVVDHQNNKWASVNIFGGGWKIGYTQNDSNWIYFDHRTIGSDSLNRLALKGAVVDKNNVKWFGSIYGLISYDGNNWFVLDSSNSPIPANVFHTGTVDRFNNKIFGLSNKGFVFYNEDSVIVTSVDDQFQLVENFYLYQNYPNPFNPKTIISWDAPVASRNTLKVYDILGNEIATLVNEYKAAGRHQVEFDATGLPSGVYVYKLTAGSFISSKKMVVIK